MNLKIVLIPLISFGVGLGLAYYFHVQSGFAIPKEDVEACTKRPMEISTNLAVRKLEILAGPRGRFEIFNYRIKSIRFEESKATWIADVEYDGKDPSIPRSFKLLDNCEKKEGFLKHFLRARN
jgi:hypothetical protein